MILCNYLHAHMTLNEAAGCDGGGDELHPACSLSLPVSGYTFNVTESATWSPMRRIDEVQRSPFGEFAFAVWQSDTYRAAAFHDDGAIRLTIGRVDLADGIGWDELQRIKNECGFADKDAVEFYPCESDVINTGNLRHLYVFDEPLPLVRRNEQGLRRHARGDEG